MIFPSLGDMQNIYRLHAPMAILMCLPHLLINIVGLTLFSVQYHFLSR